MFKWPDLNRFTQVAVIYHSPCCDGFASWYTLFDTILPSYGFNEVEGVEDIHNACYRPTDEWVNFGTVLPGSNKRVQGVGIPTGSKMTNPVIAEKMETIARWGTSSAKVILIVDLSLPDTVIDFFEAQGWEVFVIDHHETAPEVVGSRFANTDHFIFQKEGISGAGLMLQWCRDCDIPVSHGLSQLCQYVEDRDVWAWKLLSSKEINTVIHYTKLTLDAWANLEELFKWSRNELISDGSRMCQVSDEILDRSTRPDRIGWIPLGSKGQVPIVNSNTMVSEIGDKLCGLVENTLGLAIIWYMQGDGVISCSFRSRARHGFPSNYTSDVGWEGEKIEAYNCAELAKSFGGGGHKPAAGCRFMNFDEMVDGLKMYFAKIDTTHMIDSRSGLKMLWSPIDLP